MKRSYDAVAWIYDLLAKLVFGKALINAQLYLLKAIPPGANVIIIGGGTGWILEELSRIHPSGLTITYVDASGKMIAKAKKRNTGENEVIFIASAFERLELGNWDIGFGYDIVLTPFLLDNLTEDVVKKICAKVDSLLVPQAKWLYCDFEYTGIFWQKVLLKTMYVFFRICCAVKASSLPDVSAIFFRQQYRIIAHKTFFRRFVVSEIYEKG